MHREQHRKNQQKCVHTVLGHLPYFLGVKTLLWDFPLIPEVSALAWDVSLITHVCLP